MAALLEKYKAEIVPAMMERFGHKNRMAVPKLEKIVVNAGVGRAPEEKERLEQSLTDLALITGQKPVPTKARKSVAGFKTRDGMIIGTMVTLRGERMYEFLERLIVVAIPRIRDFRGLPASSFDGHGNYSFGITEQAVFPEVDPDSVKVTQGMHITLVTTARGAHAVDEGRELLRLLGMPLATEQGA